MASNLDDLKRALYSFLEANPTSSIRSSSASSDGDQEFAVELPWNDSSLEFVLTTDTAPIIEALNSLYLPERLSGVWHKAASRLEVLWTAFPVVDSLKDVITRKFEFSYRGNKHLCCFNDTSEEVMLLAKSVRIKQYTDTQGRNFPSYANYMLMCEEEEMSPFVSLCRPLSFYVDNIDCSDAEYINILSSLNFYMSYFDKSTPRIMIHPPRIDKSAYSISRYICDKFPNTILGRDLDNNLLHYWEAALSGDFGRRYLYYYRIIEYSSSLYVDTVNRAAMKRALAAPNALDDIERLSEEIITITARVKMDEHARMEAMIKEYVEFSKMWKEIEKHREYFSSKIDFDGGFSLSPFMDSKTKESDFFANFGVVFVRFIRDIRNALSHGKDQKTQSVIVPTTHNFSQLQPWVALTAVAAGDIILNR